VNAAGPLDRVREIGRRQRARQQPAGVSGRYTRADDRQQILA
jgi:hypothetical protein